MDNTNALTLRGQLPVGTFAELEKAGELLSRSNMFGACNPAAGFVIAATCHQQGISLMEFQRTYHIVDGKPSMRADAMLAEFRKRGGKYRIVENSMARAAIEATFEGQTLTFEYTMEDGKRTGDALKSNGAVKDNWTKRPDDMMWARVVSKMVRRMCPEINAGLYPPEEVQDFDAPSPRATREPVAISAEEAARRARSVAAEVSEPVAVAEPDYTRCPDGFGELSGQPWTDLPGDILRAALECDDARITEQHKAEIRKAGQRRED